MSVSARKKSFASFAEQGKMRTIHAVYCPALSMKALTSTAGLSSS